jgi:DNA-binding transcriptional LysR family regulator
MNHVQVDRRHDTHKQSEFGLPRTCAAADRLHASQPSIDDTLKRLRDLLGEPLFKRMREGTAPTHFAVSLCGKFRNAILEIEGTIEMRANSILTGQIGVSPDGVRHRRNLLRAPHLGDAREDGWNARSARI